jgi:hypothetical protein
LPQLARLADSDCIFLQNVSAAIRSNNLEAMVVEAQSYQRGRGDGEWSKDAIEVIASDIDDINKYSERADELEASLSSLQPLSILKAWSPMLLGLGVGIRLARTHFDVKTEQEKQRCESAAAMPSPAVTTTNDGGSASDKSPAISPPIDATMIGEASDRGVLSSLVIQTKG